MKTKIVVIIDGGCLSEVCCSDPAAEVVIIDMDNLKADGLSADEREAEYDKATDGLHAVG